MTDLQKFIALYASLGIPLETEENDEGIEIILQQSNDHGKFEGYGGFYSSVQFNHAGKFIKQGFWE